MYFVKSAINFSMVDALEMCSGEEKIIIIVVNGMRVLNLICLVFCSVLYPWERGGV